MERQQFFFQGNDSNQLFGFCYIPEVKTKPKGYLIIHPFGEEKKSSHQTLVKIATALCEQGFYVCLFDLRGCGDSCGNLRDTGITHWLDDIHSALAAFRARSGQENIGLVGLRFGGYLALLYNYFHEQVSDIILIEPVLHPLLYLRKALRSKLIKELCTEGEISSNRAGLLNKLKDASSIDFDGHQLGGLFYKELTDYEGAYESNILLKKIKAGMVVSVTMTGKTSADVLEVNGIRSEIHTRSLKMELFWNKIDESETDKLADEVTNYALTLYNTYA